MIPVTDLEMAASTTFASIVNEIQLSNLNFTIKMTPFAAYITLKKTVQKDVNGVKVNPAPPLLFLLNKAQENVHRLEVENYELKAAAESSAYEAGVLINSLNESKTSVEVLTNENIILKKKIAIAEKEASTNHAAKTDYEYKIKDDKKKHFEELNGLQTQMKNITKENKLRAKEIHNLNKNLENCRATLKSCKAERSQLKTNKAKLEAEIKKLKHCAHKERKETHVKAFESDHKDINANINVEASKHAVVSNVSSPIVISSMVSHFVPNFSSNKPAELVPIIAQATHEHLETTENKDIELEEKEEGFIGPKLPRVMTKEEVKALFRELFPNSDKYK